MVFVKKKTIANRKIAANRAKKPKLSSDNSTASCSKDDNSTASCSTASSSSVNDPGCDANIRDETVEQNSSENVEENTDFGSVTNDSDVDMREDIAEQNSSDYIDDLIGSELDDSGVNYEAPVHKTSGTAKPRKTQYLTKKNNKEWVSLDGHRIVDIDYLLSWSLKLGVYHAKECTKVDLYPYVETNSKHAMTVVVILKCGGCGARFAGHYTNPAKENQLAKAVVVGTLVTGQSYSSTAGLMASLGVKMMSETYFYKLEPLLDEPLEAIFKTSCLDARKKEEKIARNDGKVDHTGTPLVKVSQDGAYSKRSYGSGYNSASGCAAIVGEATGMIIWGGVKNRDCYYCDHKQQEDGTVPQHKCYKNHNGPSGNMESDLLLEGHVEVNRESSLILSPILTDGDTKLFLRLKEKLKWGALLRKLECCNHAVRAMCNRCKTAVSGRTSAAKKIMKSKIPRIGKAARCAINYNAANKGTVENLQHDFRNLLYHLLGVHDRCRAYFCKFAQAEEKKTQEDNFEDDYEDDDESESEDGVILSDEPTTSDEFEIVYNDPIWKTFMAIMEDMAEKAEYLLEGSTSNRPESVFSCVAKFVGGKRIYYGSRGEYYRRALCGFVQYNEGYSWQGDLFEKFVGCKPFASMNDYIESRDKKHQYNLSTRTSQKRIRGQSSRKTNSNSYMPDHERELTGHITDEDRRKCILKFQEVSETYRPPDFETIQQLSESRLLTQNVFDVVRSQNGSSLAKKASELICRKQNFLVLRATLSLRANILEKIPDKFGPSEILICTCHPYMCAVPDGITSDKILIIKRVKRGSHKSIKCAADANELPVKLDFHGSRNDIVSTSIEILRCP